MSCGVQGHAGCFGKRAGGARCPGFQVRGVGQLWLEGQVRDLLGGAADASRRGLRPRAASVRVVRVRDSGEGFGVGGGGPGAPPPWRPRHGRV